jgi:N-sulfoglucosamine sulfohydrolase
MNSSQPRRSVLFIIADDWSPIAGCYGNQVIQTPNVDRAAKKGVVFDEAFCVSPSCAVSRACILTGQYPHTHGQYGHCHGINGFRTHPWIATTPGLLKQAGYATACIGKNHVAPPELYPFEFEALKSPPRSPLPYGEETARFLKEIGDRPFYCHVGARAPHRGGDSTKFDNDPPQDGAVTYRPEDVTVPDFLPDVPEVRYELAQYYQAISRFDQTVGEVLKALEQSGRREETLVVITSDHGMPFPGAKASSFEGGHHCPLIVFGPSDIQSGRHSGALVNWTDFMPTILEWCGVEAPPDLPGRSMLPLLSDPDQNGWDETYYSHIFHEVTNYYPYRVLRGRRYKYVLNLANELPHPLGTDLFRSLMWQTVLQRDIQMLGKRPREYFLHQPHEALYDLEADPAESQNLIDRPEHRQRVKEMRAKVLQFRIETKDPWLELSMQRGGPEAPARS